MFQINSYFLTIILLISVNVKSQNLQINEVVSKNYNGLESFEGKTEDWIEIFNNSNDTLQLQNYYLSDDENNLQVWQFPNLEIYPDSFLVVFASNENLITPELHTNFKLSSEGEKLFLSNTSIIDSITIPALKADFSFGRKNEQSNEWSILDIPSPNFSNSESNHLTFSHESGFYTNAFDLTIQALRTNHTIYYTLDGSEPSINSLVYGSSLNITDVSFKENNFSNIITTANHSEIEEQHQIPNSNINKTNILQIASFYNNKKTSKTYSKSFFINNSNYDIPIISIITEAENFFSDSLGIYVPGNSWDINNPSWSGNYHQRGAQAEKPVYLSYFDEEKKLLFEHKAGVKIHGGLTRTKPQKSLRFYARKSYGKKSFQIPFFEPFVYDKFIVKSMFSSWNKTLISDYLALKSAESLDLEQQTFKPVIIYLNGEYWGIHLMGERLDDDFLKEQINLSNDDSINLLTQGLGFDISGSNLSFRALKTFIETNDLTNTAHYDYVNTKIDIDNFITYHIYEMFFNNIDWPMNNIKFWNANGRKWRYILFDLDGSTDSFGYNVDWNMFTTMTETDGAEWPNPPESNSIFRKLISNENFKNKFIVRYIELLNNELSYNSLKANFDEIITDLEKHLPEHIARWNYPTDMAEWEYKLRTRTLNFIEKRQCIVNQQMIDHFQLDNTSYECINEKFDLSFTLYPNPAKKVLNIIFEDEKSQPSFIEYKIFDSLGKVVDKGSKIVLNNTKIDLKSEFKGLYFIEILKEKSRPKTKKFIAL